MIKIVYYLPICSKHFKSKQTATMHSYRFFMHKIFRYRLLVINSALILNLDNELNVIIMYCIFFHDVYIYSNKHGRIKQTNTFYNYQLHIVKFDFWIIIT